MMPLILRFVFLLLGIAASAAANAGPAASCHDSVWNQEQKTCSDASTNAFIPKQRTSSNDVVSSLRGGGQYFIPAGYNPTGYKITATGLEFLAFEGSPECDVGRFIASLKAGRKRKATLKASWLEIVRVSKTGQAMRIYRNIDDIIKFCIKTGLID